MKRFLSILLTLVLSLSIVAAIPAYATETNAFKVGDNTFATLAEAYASLPAEGGVIELVSDYESETDVGLVFDKPVVIKSTDGQKYKLTLTAPTEALAKWIKSTAALTIKSIDLSTSRGIEMTNAPFTIEDSTVLMHTLLTGESLKGNNSYPFLSQEGNVATITRTSIEQNSVNQSKSRPDYSCNKEIDGTNAIRLWGKTVTLNILDNSSVSLTGTHSNKMVANHVIFIDYFDNKTEGTDATITVGKNCTVTNALKQGGPNDPGGKRPAICIYLRTGANPTAEGIAPSTLNLTLEEGSRLEVLSPVIGNSNTKAGWVMANGKDVYYEDVTVIDNGCTYAVCAPYLYEQANLGSSQFDSKIMYFPKISNATDEMVFHADNVVDSIPNLGSFKLPEAEVLYEFTFGVGPAPLEPLVANIEGAAIRTDAPYGIRFGATVDKVTYDAFVADGSTIVFGLAISSYEIAFGGDFHDDYALLIEDGTVRVMDEITVDGLAEDNTFSFSVFFTEEMEDLLTTTYYASAYYTITYANGKTETVFAETVNVRSIYDVASAYKTKADAGEEGFPQIDYINEIVTACA